jgi:hypothetical protein
MINKCINIAKQFDEKISQEEDLNNSGDYSDDLLQKADSYDNLSVNTSKTITAHPIAV